MSKDENYIVLDKCHDGKDTIQVIKSMRNTITNQALLLEEIINHCNNEVWYQELRLNAKNPSCQIKEQKDKEIAINRKEFAESILTKVKNWEGNKNGK